MKLTSYGLFWRESEIEWNPGKGYKNSFRLLGRIGSNKGVIRIADFRHQQGIYILYDEYGPAYVGLTRSQGLGKRLKDHKSDNMKGKWDRFSWFGFYPLIRRSTSEGIEELGNPETEISEDTNTTIGDLEALLIRAIGPKRNSSIMQFRDAEKWTQIEYENTEKYMQRLEIPTA